MTPEDLTPIERRLRDAYADAAATVQRRNLTPDVPTQPAIPPGRPGRGRNSLVISLAAAAAVLLVAIVPLAILRSPHPGPQPPHPKVAARTPVPTPTQTPYRAPPPKYLVTLYGIGSGLLEVRNAVTGTLTATIKVPIASGYWYALAAQNARTFIASEDVTLPKPSASYFYRFVIGSHGTVTSISRVGRVVYGTVMSASITPDGRYVGYLLLANGSAKVQVVLANLTTGKVLAFWPIPASDTIVSMSVDADGNALAVSAYTYSHYNFHTTEQKALEHADLVQWTSVLRPATSGTSLGKLRKLLRQAGTLALSPGGGTLYEFVQAGHVTGSSFLDPKPVTFDLAAINARSGAVIFVLHTWQAVWADFSPQLALGPAGGYLLIADDTSLASADTATGQYTALPGSVPSVNTGNKFSPFFQGGDIDPLAW
jgi:hypothetical protein